MEFWRFVRAGAAMSAYDEARESGSKHSFAVTQAADSVRQLHPEMPISETQVKRILAAWRPRKARVILRFKRSILTEEETNKIQWIWEQLAALHEEKALMLPVLRNDNPPKSGTLFTICFGERPNYPRYNHKTPTE